MGINTLTTDGTLNVTPDGNGKVTIPDGAINSVDITANTMSSSSGNLELTAAGSGKLIVSADVSSVGTDTSFASVTVDGILIDGSEIKAPAGSADLVITPAAGSSVITNSIMSATSSNLVLAAPSASEKVVIASASLVGDLYLSTNDISTRTANADITITPNGAGSVVVQSRLAVDNIKLDGNTIATSDPNGDLTLSPDGAGEVVVGTSLHVDNLSFDASTLSTIATDGNLLLSPATSKVVTGSTTMQLLNIDNFNLDANTITTTGTDTDLILSVPSGNGKVTAAVVAMTTLAVGNFNIASNTLSSTDSDGNMMLNTGAKTVLPTLSVSAGGLLAAGDLELLTSAATIKTTADDVNLALSPAGDGKVVVSGTMSATSMLTSDAKLEGSILTMTTQDANFQVTPHGTGKVRFPPNMKVGNLRMEGNGLCTDGNLVLLPAGAGKVKFDVARIGNTVLSGNTVGSNAAGDDVVIEPNGVGKLIFSSPMKVDNVIFSDTEVTTAGTDDNLLLTANGDGKVTIKNIAIGSNSIAKTDATAFDLSTTVGQNIVLTATGGGHVALAELQYTGESAAAVTSTGSNSMTLLPAINQHVRLAAGKVTINSDKTYPNSATLEVGGDVSASQYIMSTALENPSNALAVLYQPSAFGNFIVPLEREITLSVATTVLIHYQVSMDFRIASNGKSTFGVLSTTLFNGNTEVSSAARASNGVLKSGDDIGSNFVTNAGTWAETLDAGTYTFSVRYRQDVCAGSCYGLTTANQELRTMHQPGEDGQTRSLQIIVLGSEGA